MPEGDSSMMLKRPRLVLEEMSTVTCTCSARVTRPAPAHAASKRSSVRSRPASATSPAAPPSHSVSHLHQSL